MDVPFDLDPAFVLCLLVDALAHGFGPNSPHLAIAGVVQDCRYLRRPIDLLLSWKPVQGLAVALGISESYLPCNALDLWSMARVQDTV